VIRRLAPALVAVALLAVACGSDGKDDASSAPAKDEGTSAFAYGTGACPPATPPAETPRGFDDAPKKCIEDGTDYGATVETSEGTITIDLDEQGAPGTVNNFVVLARYGWFDGDDFHRVVPGFVAQAGDPFGDPQGTGGPGYTIPDELPTSRYAKGDVAMANTGQPGTGGSQFFLCDTGCSTLPPQYSRFGTMTGGLDVFAEIMALGVTDGPPSKPVDITKVTITEQ
jgi:cyclophilin family peptidyl-prolyl cis-trans isomerase